MKTILAAYSGVLKGKSFFLSVPQWAKLNWREQTNQEMFPEKVKDVKHAAQDSIDGFMLSMTRGQQID